MGLKNCEKCGKVFNSETDRDVNCAECGAEEQKELKKVMEFLRKNPLANVMEVFEKTGVSQSRILKFIKGGSLKMRKPVNESKCRICGRPVVSGNICTSCRNKVEKGILKPGEKRKKR